MITKPPIDDLVDIAKNKYILCCALSKRAKQINDLQNKNEEIEREKPISFAANELVTGKVVITEE